MFGCDLNSFPILTKSKSCEPRVKGMDSLENFVIRMEPGLMPADESLGSDLGSKVNGSEEIGNEFNKETRFLTPEENVNEINEPAFQSELESLPFFNEKSYDPYAILCKICLKNSITFVTLDCKHAFCDSCIHLYFVSLIESFKLKPSEWSCPECQMKISKSKFHEHLRPEDFLRLENLKIKRKGMLLVAQNEAIHCPRLDCPGFGYIFTDQVTTACVHCKCTLCLLCKCEFHPYTECGLSEIDDLDLEFNGLLLTNGWKRCPNCAVPIEKTEGCQFITCYSPVCIGEFHLCNICGKSLTVDYHFGHFISEGVFGDVCNTLENLEDICDT